MSVEAIEKVKIAEENFNNQISDAKLKAEQIIQEAKENAKKNYEDTINSANAKRDQLLEKAKEEAKLKTTPIISEAKKSVEEISNITDNDLSAIVKSILERIVVSNGNS